MTSPSLTAITRATLAKDLRLEWRSKDAIKTERLTKSMMLISREM